MISLFFIAATRPNFVKIAPFFQCLHQFPSIQAKLVHTGQHYDKNMSDSFFDLLRIPTPDFNLGVGGGTHAEQTGKTMMKFEALCLEHKPDGVIVFGDVNATMACAISAKKCHIPVIHVEAGLRSFDRDMPEEINRIVTDSISDVLYTTSPEANDQLLKEGAPASSISYQGNVMIDTLMNNLDEARKNTISQTYNLKKGEFIYLTMHRPSNVDDPAVLKQFIDTFHDISKDIDIVFPIHPRTKEKLHTIGELEGLINNPKIHIMPPINYMENIHFVIHSKIVITDSGGLQEETTALRIPCLTIRNNTERPITITEGSNTLVGNDASVLKAHILRLLNQPPTITTTPKFWDGKAAQRILSDLNTRFSQGFLSR